MDPQSLVAPAALLVAIAALAVAIIQARIARTSQREAAASAQEAKEAADQTAEHLARIVDVVTPQPWKAERRTDQPGYSFHFRNTSGGTLTTAELHVGDAHILLGTIPAGGVTNVYDLEPFGVGYQVEITTAETGRIVVPLPASGSPPRPDLLRGS